MPTSQINSGQFGQLSMVARMVGDRSGSKARFACARLTLLTTVTALGFAGRLVGSPGGEGGGV